MTAYMIVDTKIKNADAYEEYKALARPLAEKFGGQYRVRGGEMVACETDLWSPTRMVVIEFPDMAAARAFYESNEYEPIKKIRRANSECTVVLVDGI